MTDKQVIMKLLKIRKTTPKMKLGLSNIIDPDSKNYNKKYLAMTLPVSNTVYNEFVKNKYNALNAKKH